MDEETGVLVRIRVDRSLEDMDTAKELLSLGRYRAAVNRAYYAIFSITTALLLTQKIERSERERHITENHPDLLPEYREQVVRTLLEPDQVRLSARFKKARLFSRWFDFVRGGKYIVLVVISEGKPSKRHWVITAYMARKLAGGDIEWKKN